MKGFLCWGCYCRQRGGESMIWVFAGIAKQVYGVGMESFRDN